MLRAKEIGMILDRTRILDNVSFEVERGERVAFVGPSGVGKTTLFRILAGNLTPAGGCLCLDGIEVSAPGTRPHPLLRRHTGMVHQQKNLIPSLKVVHNVLMGRLGQYSPLKSLLSLLWPMEWRRALAALERVGLPHKLMVRADTLSGGEMQRVALARLLLRDPEILLADEPVSALDEASGEELMKLLVSLYGESGKSLLVSTHNISHVRSYFHRVVGLRRGVVLFDLPVAEVSAELLNELYREGPPIRHPADPFRPASLPRRTLCATPVDVEAPDQKARVT